MHFDWRVTAGVLNDYFVLTELFANANRISGNSATDISARIQRRGGAVSAREVNNKIQRTRESIEEKCLTELSNREELAAFLVTHKLITKQDIHDFVLDQ